VFTTTTLVSVEVPIFSKYTSDPTTFIASAPNVPKFTWSFENTSRIGIPEMSLTENRDPDKLSTTENNLPLSPSTENSVDPDPLTFNSLPSKVKLASPLNGVAPPVAVTT
jgi:hypothetical protein